MLTSLQCIFEILCSVVLEKTNLYKSVSASDDYLKKNFEIHVVRSIDDLMIHTKYISYYPSDCKYKNLDTHEFLFFIRMFICLRYNKNLLKYHG